MTGLVNRVALLQTLSGCRGWGWQDRKEFIEKLKLGFIKIFFIVGVGLVMLGEWQVQMGAFTGVGKDLDSLNCI